MTWNSKNTTRVYIFRTTEKNNQDYLKDTLPNDERIHLLALIEKQKYIE